MTTYCNACCKKLTENEISISKLPHEFDDYKGLCAKCAVEKDIESGFDAVEEPEKKHGGKRIAGPGKKIGRPFRAHKKKKVSYCLNIDAIKKLEIMVSINGWSKSEFIERLIYLEYIK